jgi:ketosteroid isomerase-like protein
MNSEFAQAFARDWIAAWNAHDLDAVLSHYSDDFEMSSPIIQQLMHEASGTLTGKPAVRAYWAKALQKIPDLHFELITTLVGANSLVLYYRGHRGEAAEVFVFNAAGQVVRAFAHYALAP